MNVQLNVTKNKICAIFKEHGYYLHINHVFSPHRILNFSLILHCTAYFSNGRSMFFLGSSFSFIYAALLCVYAAFVALLTMLDV